jgi:hypothetical protein
MDYEFPDSVMLVFCKAPIAGQVKTRLQPELNAEQAMQAHIDLTIMTLERACQTPLCPVVLCCAPDSQHPFFQQCASQYSLTLINQYGKDLGERMHNAFTQALLQYRHALLMGCDCPSLTVDNLRHSLKVLQNGNDVVIAPAEDGGYVMIGLNKPQPVLFNDMVWGVDSVMSATRKRIIKAGMTFHELVSQWDVDTINDWRRYLSLQNSSKSQ